ncbi:MAG: hypothetical protein JEZ03_07970 [Bacteroidales bacterium]|nr:hypothetical protein [Bacteroidales bacterium]
MSRNFMSVICLVSVLFMSSQLLYSQWNHEAHEKLIRVYSSVHHLKPPFPTLEVEMSNNIISYRNVLAPRANMRESWLASYDECNTDTVRVVMEKDDYKKIEQFILTSGILEIDMTYDKPLVQNGIIGAISGGGTHKYIVITTERTLELPVYGEYIRELPQLLIEFDSLFKKFHKKYNPY